MQKVLKILKNIGIYTFITCLWLVMIIYCIAFYPNLYQKIIGNIFYKGTWAVSSIISDARMIDETTQDFLANSTGYIKHYNIKIEHQPIGTPIQTVVSLKTTLFTQPQFLVNYNAINIDTKTKRWTYSKKDLAYRYNVVSGGLGYPNIISGDHLEIPLGDKGIYTKITRKAIFY